MESQYVIQRSKYFLNSKDTIVSDFLTGLCLSNSNLLYYKDHNVIVDSSQLKENKVRLICGGGSGHEPAHAGYVQEGMLTAAVCGDIFSSPSYVNILKAIDLVYTDAGVVLLIKNYTGDLINFRLAKEIAKEQGKKIEILIVDDDISLIEDHSQTEKDFNNHNTNVFNKKRGLCAIVLVYKILGAMSKSGKSLEEIIDCGRNIIPNLYTVGVSLTNCSLPYAEYENNSEIPSDEVEIGLGIHGEKGKERIKYKNISQVLDYLFTNFFKQHLFNKEEKHLENNNDILLMVNNLGSLTDIEIFSIINSLYNFFTKKQDDEFKVNTSRIIYGKLMTSLDMKGFSLTIFKFDENNLYLNQNKDYLISLVDQEVSSTNWNIINTHKINLSNVVFHEEKLNNKYSETPIKNLFRKLSEYLITQSNYLNELDKEVGDGDLGSGVEKALHHILSRLDYLDFENNIRNSFKSLGDMIASSFGGTSGPLYAAFFLKGSQMLNQKESDNGLHNWIEAFISGVKMIQTIGKAELGDRTMLDILFPIADALESSDNIKIQIADFKIHIDSVINSSLAKIKNLKSKRGRSSYMGGKEIGKDDPGSVLVALWMKFILNKI